MKPNQPPVPTKCCNSCALLACNKDKPNPEIGKNDMPWYAQKNIDRLWKNVQASGLFLTCHSTHDAYFAKDNDNLIACIGMTAAIFMHLKIYEAEMNKDPHEKGPVIYRRYAAIVGKTAMKNVAMMQAVWAFSMGRNDVFGKMRIPQAIGERRGLRFPSGFTPVVAAFKDITGMDFTKTNTND